MVFWVRAGAARRRCWRASSADAASTQAKSGCWAAGRGSRAAASLGRASATCRRISRSTASSPSRRLWYTLDGFSASKRRRSRSDSPFCSSSSNCPQKIVWSRHSGERGLPWYCNFSNKLHWVWVEGCKLFQAWPASSGPYFDNIAKYSSEKNRFFSFSYLI